MATKMLADILNTHTTHMLIEVMIVAALMRVRMLMMGKGKKRLRLRMKKRQNIQ
jgi:hypothetical protein